MKNNNPYIYIINMLACITLFFVMVIFLMIDNLLYGIFAFGILLFMFALYSFTSARFLKPSRYDYFFMFFLFYSLTIFIFKQTLWFYGLYWAISVGFLSFYLSRTLFYNSKMGKVAELSLACIAILLLANVFLVYNQIIGTGVLLFFKDRFVTPFGRSNTIGGYILVLWYLVENLPINRYMLYFTKLLFLACMMIIASRWTIICIILIHLLTSKNKIRSSFIITITLIGLYFIGSLYLGQGLDNLLLYNLNKSASLNDISSGRIAIYQELLLKFIEHPFFGYGLGGIISDISGGEPIRAHNLFLDILVMTGFFGTILYFCGYFILINEASKKNASVYSALLAALLHSLGEPFLLSPKSTFLVFSLIGMFWYREQKSEVKYEPKINIMTP